MASSLMDVCNPPSLAALTPIAAPAPTAAPKHPDNKTDDASKDKINFVFVCVMKKLIWKKEKTNQYPYYVVQFHALSRCLKRKPLTAMASNRMDACWNLGRDTIK